MAWLVNRTRVRTLSPVPSRSTLSTRRRMGPTGMPSMGIVRTMTSSLTVTVVEISCLIGS